MANAELPQFYGSAHTHSTYAGSDLAAGAGNPIWQGSSTSMLNQASLMPAVVRTKGPPMRPPVQKFLKEAKMADTRRYVQIFIADPDPKVPIGQALIHSSEPMMTDMDDQELFFTLEIKRLLDHYNETVRTKIVDKDVKDRTAYLEPARIRDIAMTVTTVAKFGS